MAQWQIKEISDLTSISIRMLRHYDKIGLLKPSLRRENKYRYYSEANLATLQQIIALKFFGFNLKQIKTMLHNSQTIAQNLNVQRVVIEQQVATLCKTAELINSVVAGLEPSGIPNWKQLISLIERYQMQNDVKKTWVSVLSNSEQAQYAEFLSELKKKSGPKDEEIFTNKWLNLVDQIKLNLHNDPASPIGIKTAKELSEMLFAMYGKKHANLRTAIWEKVKQGAMDSFRATSPEAIELIDKSTHHFPYVISPEIAQWLDKAMDNYTYNRAHIILAQIELGETAALLQQWNDLVDELCGQGVELRRQFYNNMKANLEHKIGPNAKKWLEALSKN